MNIDRKNLESAFAGKSQARNKYTYFAFVAKKEGYEQIASLFAAESSCRSALRGEVLLFLISKYTVVML